MTRSNGLLGSPPYSNTGVSTHQFLRMTFPFFWYPVFWSPKNQCRNHLWSIVPYSLPQTSFLLHLFIQTKSLIMAPVTLQANPSPLCYLWVCPDSRPLLFSRPHYYIWTSIPFMAYLFPLDGLRLWTNSSDKLLVTQTVIKASVRICVLRTFVCHVRVCFCGWYTWNQGISCLFVSYSRNIWCH